MKNQDDSTGILTLPGYIKSVRIMITAKQPTEKFISNK